jgi:gliding-associated putative ABC transporter substrate-binding component GldG
MLQANGEGTVALPVETNLEDLFFKYGIRINRNYVADANCSATPIYTGAVGDQPRIEMLPWPYFPVVTNYGDHPLVKNLDATLFRGCSTLDTVKADGIVKTPLFLTSENTKVFGPPVKVSYNDLQDKLVPEAFTSGVQPLGYLMEGKFSSLYRNRFLPAGAEKKDFREIGDDATIIFVSDGDFIRNDFSLENDRPLAIGVDPYNQTTYANEQFLMNALDYMLDDQQLMLSKRKEIKIRPLDKARLSTDGEFWKWTNLLAPLLLLALFGLIKNVMRKNQYGKR